MAKKPIEDERIWSEKHPIRSVLNRTSQSDRPISCVHQEETRRAARPIRFVWQDDKADASSYKTEASAQPIKRLRSILRTNLQTEASAQPIKRLRSILWTNLQTEASDQPITYIGRIIFRRTFFGRIIPQDGIVGSANHIHRSDYLRTDFLRTDHPSVRNPQDNHVT